MKKSIVTILTIILAATVVFAQDYKIVVEPENPTMKVGESLKLTSKVVDDGGDEVDGRRIAYYSFARRSVSVDSTGVLNAIAPGEFKVIVVSPSADGKYIRKDIVVNIAFPPIAKVVVEDVPEKVYAGTTLPLKVKVLDEMNMERDNVAVKMSSSNADVAQTDAFLNIHAGSPGTATITTTSEGISSDIKITVVENPVKKLDLETNMEQARTGDVFHFKTNAFDGKGNVVDDAPVIYTFSGVADDVSSSASGLIKNDGRFVADEAGIYTITATSGPFAARKTVKILPRNVKRKIEKVGHGSVNTKHTSDFWIWEGVDGKDYGVTGTWGADGTAYFWDVTDPSNIQKIDSVQVDARTVNDVKISEDGKVCIISREGASNRKNGIVIIDVSDPRNVEIISTFTENSQGGVHNLFIYQNHVYALSNGEKYYIINIEDPKTPKIVGKFELDTPGHAIHDVWIEDGIAYSSNWSDGVWLVDVGNGIAGGSPANPVAFANYAYPSGAHHATFPFHSQSTDKFYTILGDEIFPYGLDPEGEMMAGGFIHFVDFTDLDNPEEIARYELPNAGSHNYWVDGDILYLAYYNGGVRVVDISGELMGDLYKQGREIAFIIPSDPNGYVPKRSLYLGSTIV